MAKMCNNCVIFSGEASAIANVQALFKEIQDHQEATGNWRLPSYVTADFSHMQDISINQEKIQYKTRWYPNFEGLAQIADHYLLDFVNNYSDLSHALFGEARYQHGVFNDVRLEPEDFEFYQYDKETGLFVYEGKNYSFEWPICEKMLEQRKENNNKCRTMRQQTGLSR